MIAALAVFWKFARKFPLWAWAIVALGTWCWLQHGTINRLQAAADKAKIEDAARTLVNEEIGRIVARHAAQLKDQRNEEDRITRSRYERTIASLRNRKDRLPEAARGPCEGSTGRELARPDGEFLAWFGAEARRLQTEVAECHAWIDAAKRQRGPAAQPE